MLLVIPSRNFLLFTPNTLLDKQSNSYVEKMINDEVNAERKEEVNAERMEEYCSLNCWYVVVHVYAVLCKFGITCITLSSKLFLYFHRIFRFIIFCHFQILSTLTTFAKVFQILTFETNVCMHPQFHVVRKR